MMRKLVIRTKPSTLLRVKLDLPIASSVESPPVVVAAGASPAEVEEAVEALSLVELVDP